MVLGLAQASHMHPAGQGRPQDNLGGLLGVLQPSLSFVFTKKSQDTFPVYLDQRVCQTHIEPSSMVSVPRGNRPVEWLTNILKAILITTLADLDQYKNHYAVFLSTQRKPK